MSDPILSVHNLVGGYGKMTILNGTTFSVPQATITTIIGPNGAGKSTVFKAIFGLLKLREGKVSFAGRDVTNLSQRALLNAGVCYVPQGRNIFPELSVRHNVELGGVAAGKGLDLPKRIEAALDLFPALRRKSAQQASTLSGGEQKQLEIARSLLLEPKLVLIDEPSIGLSPLMVQQTFDILKSLRDRGVTILMIEQNARSALEISDIGIVLELGQTRMVDGAKRILNDPPHRPALPRGSHGGDSSMNKRSIATVSLSGALDEKLRAIAAAGFDEVEIFENDLLSFGAGPRDIAKLCRDLNLKICAFQPFRDFEGMPEPQRARNFARAERKFDLMQELGTDLLLICSNVSPSSLGGIDRAADDFRELGDRAAKRGLRVGYEALAWGRHVNDYRDAWEIVRRADHPRSASSSTVFMHSPRLSGPRDGLDPRRQDLSGAARRRTKARARHLVLEPALPLVPRPGRSAGRRIHGGGRGDRLCRTAVAGDFQRPVPRRLGGPDRHRRPALADSAGGPACTGLAEARQRTTGAEGQKSRHRLHRVCRQRDQGRRNSPACCRSSDSARPASIAARRWSAGRRARSSSSSIARPTASRIRTTSRTAPASAPSRSTSTMPALPCSAPKH
ncbi:hypothetical protein BRDID11002_84300 [Bradyrhizobium diazoefficiens]